MLEEIEIGGNLIHMTLQSVLSIFILWMSTHEFGNSRCPFLHLGHPFPHLGSLLGIIARLLISPVSLGLYLCHVQQSNIISYRSVNITMGTCTFSLTGPRIRQIKRILLDTLKHIKRKSQ